MVVVLAVVLLRAMVPALVVVMGVFRAAEAVAVVVLGVAEPLLVVLVEAKLVVRFLPAAKLSPRGTLAHACYDSFILYSLFSKKNGHVPIYLYIYI